MTEAEVLEMLNLHAANGMTGYITYNTFTFGYLTVAYLAGANLSKFQAIIISSFYAIAASTFILVNATHNQAVGALVTKYPEFVNSVLWHAPWTVLVSIVQVGGILVSLYFMYNVRKAKEGS